MAKVHNWFVSVTLPDGSGITSYVYDRDTKKDVRRSWFNAHLKAARKHGLRGGRKALEKSLEMNIVQLKKDGMPAK